MAVVNSEKRYCLQPRDSKVLRFCLEMKFADIESLNLLFFKSQDLKMFAARKRVQKLEMGGFLRSVKLHPGTTKKFYLTTPKGHRELAKEESPQLIANPVTKLSVVTFEHDFGVLKSRIELEKQGRAFDWKSEKLLKKTTEAGTGRLSRDFMPDGIFVSKQGKTCAFEYENKPKTETQLREKIYRLHALMREVDPVFEACLFVTSTEPLKQKVEGITKLFPGYFVVQSAFEIGVLNDQRVR